LKTLAGNYEYVVIDNEAGMEHLSRRTTHNIDYLLMITDATVRGIHTAGRIGRLVSELEARIANRYLVLNRVRGSYPQSTADSIDSEGLELLCSVPEDEMIYETDQKGSSVWPVMDKSEAYRSLGKALKRLIPET
jgi:CO dehydrogenase maturation factor